MTVILNIALLVPNAETVTKASLTLLRITSRQGILFNIPKKAFHLAHQ
jgi:hypothetical protein